jgi:hypothetical protein
MAVVIFDKPYRANREHITRDTLRALNDVQFIGVDGEGVGPDYVMLSVGDQTLAHGGKRLTHADIFPFLYAQFQAHTGAAFIGFALTYDFTMWLKNLNQRDAYALYDEKGIAARKPRNPNMYAPFPVRHPNGEWEFDLMGNGKRFRLRPNSRKYGSYPWLYISDVFGYWQTSFVNAIDPAKWENPICTPEEYDLIKEGKARRNTAGFDEAMRVYNVTENLVLARMMRALNLGLVETANVRLKRSEWYGPGQAAQRWLTNVQAPTRLEVIDATPHPVRMRAVEAYYGGWFENLRHGIQPGQSYSYDLLSAYPAIIADLPCIVHGEWRELKGLPGPDTLALVRGTFYGVKGAASGPLPFRTRQGGIQRPHETTGTYWWHEIQAAVTAGLLDPWMLRKSWATSEIWAYYPKCKCPPPLAGIRDLYQKRLSVDKSSPQGKAIKVIMNSVYGKTAQTIGEPKFSNMIYAGMITSLCRARILEAIGSHPDGAGAVLMVNTDGITFDSPHPNLPLSDTELGAWEASVNSDLCLFMPGVYWEITAEKAKIKRRGMPQATAEYIKTEGTRLFQAWEPGQRWPVIPVTIPWQFITGKLAYARGKWETAGTAVIDGQRAFNSWPIQKRLPATNALESSPFPVGTDGSEFVTPGTESTPYRRAENVFAWIEQLENEEYQDEEWRAELIETIKPLGGI